MNPDIHSTPPALERARNLVPLRRPTSDHWVSVALADVNGLLDDHCQCELKAASNSLAILGRNPEKDELVQRLASLSREEMQHYRQVREILLARGATPSRPVPSPYLQGIRRERLGKPYNLLDDLLICALVEARSCDRFVALAQGLPSYPVEGAAELADLYGSLAKSESGHATLFVELAQMYFDPALAESELTRRCELEDQVLHTITPTARMHGGNGPL